MHRLQILQLFPLLRVRLVLYFHARLYCVIVVWVSLCAVFTFILLDLNRLLLSFGNHAHHSGLMWFQSWGVNGAEVYTSRFVVAFNTVSLFSGILFPLWKWNRSDRLLSMSTRNVCKPATPYHLISQPYPYSSVRFLDLDLVYLLKRLRMCLIVSQILLYGCCSSDGICFKMVYSVYHLTIGLFKRVILIYFVG